MTDAKIKPMLKDADDPRSSWIMATLAGLVTVGLWQLPDNLGHNILWPFTLLATWVHEMGHGMVGFVFTRFEKLEIYRNAGGVAFTGGGSAFVNALIAAGGLLGPAVAGATIIVFGRQKSRARGVLAALGLIMALSVIVFIRNAFGVFAILGWATVLLGIAFYASDRICLFCVQFLGLHFCINNFKDFNYMFSGKVVRADGRVMLSDSAAIAHNLFGPHWFWGGLVAACSLLLLGGAFYLAFKEDLGPGGAQHHPGS